ncbi:MAG: Hpt domain-containing protein, partial [Leptothrix sp. (in: b-proteobacteria)]
AALSQAAAGGAGLATADAARAHVARALDDFVATATGPVGLEPLGLPMISRPMPLGPLETPSFAPTGLEDDDEMRGVFLEESAEVLADAQAALADLGSTPSDLSAMTMVRRAFHTLKGSARMVGFPAFGEAAWACEQLYNHALAEQAPASAHLRTVTGDALGYLADWVSAIGHGTDARYAADAVVAAADTLRLAGELLRVYRLDASEPTAPAQVDVGAQSDLVDLEVPFDDSVAPVFETLQATQPVRLSPPEFAPAEATLAAPAFEFQHSDLVLDLDLDLPATPHEVDEPLPIGDASEEGASEPYWAHTAPLSEPADGPESIDDDRGLTRYAGADFEVIELTPSEGPAAAPIERVDAPELNEPSPLDAEAVAFAPASDLMSFDGEPDAPGLIDAEASDFLSLDLPLAPVDAPFAAPPPLLPDEVGESVFTDEAFDTHWSDAPPTRLDASDSRTGDLAELSLPLPFMAMDAPTDAELLAEPQAESPVDDAFAAIPVGRVDEGFDPAAPDAASFATDFNRADSVLGADLDANLASGFIASQLGTELGPTDLDLTLPLGEVGAESALGFVPEPPAEAAAPGAAIYRLDDFRAGPGDAAAGPAPVDDGIKVIGTLRLPAPLFNIYLNEADEQSRRLNNEIGLWALELERPVGQVAGALAHSLAGNSAAVGFSALSQLARDLEHALARSQQLGEGSAADARLFGDAADEIRRLLHQFAAGFLQVPPPELVERLRGWQIEALERTPVRSPESRLGDSTLDGQSPSTDFNPFDASGNEPVGIDRIEFGAAPEPARPEPAFPEPGFAEPIAPAPVVAPDRLEPVDHVDAELFPIFEEEAQELLPQLTAQVADWLHAPADPGAATACMRTLHTFKGSARLAGAMRLGELAHRFESVIEGLMGRDDLAGIDSIALEQLQHQADGLNAAFDQLRQSRSAGPVPSVQGALASPAGSALDAWLTRPVAVPDARTGFDVLGGISTRGDFAASTQFGTSVMGGFAPEQAARAAADTPADDGPPQPIDWARFVAESPPSTAQPAERTQTGTQMVRVRAPLLDRLVNLAGEVSITRSRLEAEVGSIRSSLVDLTDNLERLNQQLRDVGLQADTQLESRREAARAAAQVFDALELDRYTRLQELTRMMAESVNDVATVRSTLQRTLQTAEDELAVQARLTRELQGDLLRTRMLEFESLSERLNRVVRQAANETGKQVRFDIVGGSIEVDRGVLDRMTAAFEHLLRNCVTHGIERPDDRQAIGKDPTGSIVVSLEQEGNEVSVEIRDDGAGLDLARIRERAVAMGLVAADVKLSDKATADLIFAPGLSTAQSVTELAGRGVGLDVVRADVQAMGGRIETRTQPGRSTRFKLVLPLTTVVTQVVLLRAGSVSIAVPSNLIELVQRATPGTIEEAYTQGQYDYGGMPLPFFWLGALLQASGRGTQVGRTLPVVIVRSAQQRVALHLDEVQGTHEVVVKNLGPQLSRLPGLAGMTLLASGAVALIYNPVALAAIYGERAWAHMRVASTPLIASDTTTLPEGIDVARPAPLVLVVDDSLTVRRVTKRLLEREGYRVGLAKDGLEALDALAGERPIAVLSDIEMPRMDGFDLLRNIRSDATLASLPVIMITSRIAQKHRELAFQLGADHYLGKPYNEDELLDLLRPHVGADRRLSAS